MKDFLGIHDKYIWWGLLGIGVAALFWFLTSKQISQSSGNANTVTVPYLVPQSSSSNANTASPNANTTLSNQPNIVGSSPNSTVPNFTNPYGVATSPGEAPGTWGFMPNLVVSTPQGQNNSVSSGWFGSQPFMPINYQSPPNTQPQTAH